jgi:hypothetical protein
LARFGGRLRAWLGAAAISLISFPIAAAILIVPQLRAKVDNFQPLESVLAQLGATYGAILALVLTLSIIPIQRAAEAWSSSIIRLYRRDRATHITFVWLGVLCVVSFALAVRGLFSVPVSWVLASSLAFLGISVDILRWYHGRVCHLLDPDNAVGIILKEAKQEVDRTKTHITQIESDIYPLITGYPGSINRWINDLAEIGIKAVTRGEKPLAKTAVSAIADLTRYYLSARKFNLTLIAELEGIHPTVTSDVRLVTTPAYEALKEMSRVAVTQGDEATAIRVSEAYMVIAIHTARLGAPAFRNGSAPLTFDPIYYAFECVKYAQSKGLDDVAFQSAGILSKVSEAAPKDIDKTDIHVPVIDGLVEIAMYLYVKHRYELAEEVNGHHLSILAHLLEQQDYFFDGVLQHVLKKMEMLAPFAVESESMAGRLSPVRPLGKAYGLLSPNSLGRLFERAAMAPPKVDEETEWINPYHDLIDIADIIKVHLRRMAEKNEFGESFLLWEIDQSIKHISKVIAMILDQPLQQVHADVTELINKLSWILAFYWVAFRGKKTVSGQRATDCSKSLMFIGLLFFERWHPEVLRDCISNIRFIVESYCEIAQPAEPYTIGDLLAHLWGIRMVLIAWHNDELTQEVDRALTTKPPGLADEKWQGAQGAIMLRRQQLEERLAQRDDYMGDPDSGELLLRRLLQKAQAQAG